MEYVYTALFAPKESGKGYTARVPDLPGCATTGKDLKDALVQITDAANLWLVTAEDMSREIPAATPQQEIRTEAGDEIGLIRLDTTAYRKETDSRAVRKSVSLPAWMANRADKLKISYSQVLQDGLARLLS